MLVTEKTWAADFHWAAETGKISLILRNTLLSKTVIAQLVEKFSALHGTSRFNTINSSVLFIYLVSTTYQLVFRVYTNTIHVHFGVHSNKFLPGLMHEISSPAQTLRSSVRIPLGEWMYVCVYSMFEFS
jgi:hypothetical protein